MTLELVRPSVTSSTVSGMTPSYRDCKRIDYFGELPKTVQCGGWRDTHGSVWVNDKGQLSRRDTEHW